MRRLHRVVDYIDAHLDAELTLAELAEVAHFSAFHFHRLFTAWMGETLGEYTRRRRLQVAAMRLTAQPRVPVFEIALSVGFGSNEAFAHAFRERFGVSATTWRRDAASRPSNADQAMRKPDQAESSAVDDDGRFSDRESPRMEVKLIDRQPARIVYLRYVGPYGPPLGRFWKSRVVPWVAERGLHRREMYSISYDNPDVTAADQCRCDVGVAVDEGFVAMGDEAIMTIPGGRYATTRFFGTPDEIPVPWRWMMREWLPASSLQLDERPMFEYYGPGMRFDEATGAFECDVTIPVKPL